MSLLYLEPASSNSVANAAGNPSFPLTVLFWLGWSHIRIRSKEPFDYIFPLDYFYSHNTAHWQNCSPFLYFRPLIFWFLVRPAQKAQPAHRSICHIHSQQPSQQSLKIKDKLSIMSSVFIRHLFCQQLTLCWLCYVFFIYCDAPYTVKWLNERVSFSNLSVWKISTQKEKCDRIDKKSGRISSLPSPSLCLSRTHSSHSASLQTKKQHIVSISNLLSFFSIASEVWSYFLTHTICQVEEVKNNSVLSWKNIILVCFSGMTDFLWWSDFWFLLHKHKHCGRKWRHQTSKISFIIYICLHSFYLWF